MIVPIITMEIAFALSTKSANGFPFSPTEITPKPKNSAITITCSILASDIGPITLLGKMLTRVSIKLGASFAVYSSPEADISPKLPLNALASARPITTANAVVHI